MANTAILKASDDALQPSLSTDEDSDDWLNVDAEEFDTMLQQKLGKPSDKANQSNSDAMEVDKPDDVLAEEDERTKDQANRLNDLAKKVENFLEGKGDVEGAKFEE